MVLSIKKLHFGTFHRPHLPEVRVVEGGYPVTAWRTTCLYGVSHSRASPRLFLGAIFIRNYLRVAHYVLIRCFPQPSLAEAPSWCHLHQKLSPGDALCAYPELLTAEPRRGSSFVFIVTVRDTFEEGK